MSGQSEGSLRIQLGRLDQRIILIAHPRHFGGTQWYFMCPVRNRPASVLWKPPGATRFCSRQTWGRQVAHQSQFNDWTKRAHDVTAPSSSAAILRFEHSSSAIAVSSLLTALTGSSP